MQYIFVLFHSLFMFCCRFIRENTDARMEADLTSKSYVIFAYGPTG